MTRLFELKYRWREKRLHRALPDFTTRESNGKVETLSWVKVMGSTSKLMDEAICKTNKKVLKTMC